MKANWLLDKVSPWSYDNNAGKSDVLEGFSLSKLKDCFAQIKVVLEAGFYSIITKAKKWCGLTLCQFRLY